MDDELMKKKCTKCGEEKSLGEFYRQKKGIQGRQSHCIECVRARKVLIKSGGVSVTKRTPLFIDYDKRVKECSKCKKVLSFASFTINNGRQDGLQMKCKSCNRAYYEANAGWKAEWGREYRSKNYEEIKAKKRNYSLKNKDKIKEYGKRYRAANSDIIKKKKSDYYYKNKKIITSKNAVWREGNRDTIKKLYQQRYAILSDIYCGKAREYRTKHPARMARWKREWAQKNKNNPQYRLTRRLRDRLKHALKNDAKLGSAVGDLGCSVKDLKYYIEAKFYMRDNGEEMTWGNWSAKGWHLDHIAPLSSFDLSDREQLLKACHYTNLQPLWAEDNYAKGVKPDEVMSIPAMQELTGSICVD